MLSLLIRKFLRVPFTIKSTMIVIYLKAKCLNWVKYLSIKQDKVN